MSSPNWFLRLKTKIKSINLFEDIEKIGEEDIKNQQISTIIFLVIFPLSIIALFLYSSLTPIQKTVIINQPSLSLYKQLEEKYPNTLVCPCTSISNEYSTFISSLTPIYNQICSSDFVSDKWLNYVNYRSFTEAKYQYNMDFRHTGYSFFAMLRTLCALASKKINDQLIVFYLTELLTENAISEDTFLANIQAARDQFIAASASEFVITLDSFLSVAQVINAINRLETNFQFQINPRPNDDYYRWSDSWWVQMYPPNFSCDCTASIECSIPMAFYLPKLPNEMIPTEVYYAWGQYVAEAHFEVSGVRLGCLILNAVLQSDLSCLYTQTCLSELNANLNDSLSPFNATPLAVSSFSSSLPTIHELVNKLMVDLWEMNSSYDHYFSSCNPSTCTYTYVHQFDIIFIITTVIAFIGGIVTILMNLTLPLVTFLRKKIQVCYSLLLSSPKANSFESSPDSEKQTEWDLHGQRLSTRLFIVSMTVILFILILYTSLSSVTKTINIKQPAIDVYLDLQAKYPETLNCPCSSISNEYKHFISFNPTFHPVCYSHFLSTNWTHYLIPLNGAPGYDFRYRCQTFFPAISSFCQLSMKTVNKQLLVFNETKYVTKYVQPFDLFQLQTEQLISNMKQTTANSFQLLLSMLRQSIWGNALFVGGNYHYMPDPTLAIGNNSEIYSKNFDQVFYPAVYDLGNMTSCSCKLQPTTCNVLDTIIMLYTDQVNKT
ncbi:unnamed protein product [Adineta steineri]|uniref:Uncharacterized protein n=1 Tax=Adineta steineri TaxID=433720 RepID=A0A819SKS2_9BILA|nr:unnamed protein product [Adineta steineri]CAF4061106.1 unnamed protein product [Adineta steineri]